VIGDMLDSKRRPISVRDYHLIFEAGMFARLLTQRFNGRAVVQVQCPVAVSDDSEPEREFALLRWDPTGYEASTPSPADTYLLIEVSASSRAFDRRVKIPLYAETGIPGAWIVDVVDGPIPVSDILPSPPA
jgi:hypothetical protein